MQSFIEPENGQELLDMSDCKQLQLLTLNWQTIHKTHNGCQIKEGTKQDELKYKNYISTDINTYAEMDYLLQTQRQMHTRWQVQKQQ